MQAGWFPIGRGEITASIAGSARLLQPINCRQRGDLGGVGACPDGKSAIARDPTNDQPCREAVGRKRPHRSHLVRPRDIRLRRGGPLPWAEYSKVGLASPRTANAGSRRKVAEEAVNALLACHRSMRPSTLIWPISSSCRRRWRQVRQLHGGRVTNHLLTNAWVVEQFGLPRSKYRQKRGRVGRRDAASRREQSAMTGGSERFARCLSTIHSVVRRHIAKVRPQGSRGKSGRALAKDQYRHSAGAAAGGGSRSARIKPPAWRDGRRSQKVSPASCMITWKLD